MLLINYRGPLYIDWDLMHSKYTLNASHYFGSKQAQHRICYSATHRDRQYALTLTQNCQIVNFTLCRSFLFAPLIYTGE